MIFGYVIQFYFMCFQGFIIVEWECLAFSATTVMSVIACIIAIIFQVFSIAVPLYLPLIYLFLWGIAYMGFYFIRKAQFRKSLQVLDILEEEGTAMEKIPHPNFLFKHIIIGCITGHQFCTSLSVFKFVLEQYQDSFKILLLFAKFLAIYPEQYHQLEWVHKKVEKAKCNKYLRRYLSTQISELLVRRNTTLSSELKKKINVISSLIISVKMKIKNALEASINGNTSKLLPLFSKATNLIDEINLKFSNLISYHSNNHFALKLYASYTKDVLADYQKAKALREKTRLAQSGKISSVDQPYLFGRFYFPNMPSRQNSLAVHQINTFGSENQTVPTNSTTVSNTSTLDSSQKSSQKQVPYKRYTKEAMTLHSQVSASIDKISIPSITMWIAYLLINFFFILIIPYISFSIFAPKFSSTFTSPTNYLYLISQIKLKSMLTFCSLIGFRLSKIYQKEFICFVNNSVSSSIGGKCNFQNILQFFSSEALDQLHSIDSFQTATSKNAYFNLAQESFFLNFYNFREYESFTKYSIVSRKVYNELINLLVTSMDIGANDSTIDINSRYYQNVVENYISILEYITMTCKHLLNFHQSEVNKLMDILRKIQIAFTVCIPIVNIIVIIIFTKWLLKNQQRIYKCFSSLPKSTIYQMIQKLDISTSSHQIQELSTNISVTQHDDFQDTKDSNDKITLMLHESQNGFYNQNIALLIVFAVLFIIVITLSFFFSLQIFIDGGDYYIDSTPHISSITTSFVDLQQLTLSLSIFSKKNYFSEEKIEALNNSFLLIFEESLYNFHLFYFGNSTIHSYPLIRSAEALFNSFYREPMYKDNMTGVYDLYSIMPYDLMYYYIIEQCRKLYSTTMQLDINLSFHQMTDLAHVWNMVLINLYPHFFEPLLTGYIYQISQKMPHQTTLFFSVATILLLVGLVLFLICVYIILNFKRQLKLVLRLLLHAPPNILFQSRHITTILSGNFSIPEKTLSSLDDSSFLKTVEYSPNIIVKTDKNGKIIDMNQIGYEMLGDITQLDIRSTSNLYIANNYYFNVKKVPLSDHTFILLENKTVEHEYKQKIKEEEERRKQLLEKNIPQVILNEHKNLSHHHTIAFQAPVATVLSLNIKLNNNPISIEYYTKLIERFKNIQSFYPAVTYVDIDYYKFIAVAGIMCSSTNSEAEASQLIDFTIQAIAYCWNLRQNKNDDLLIQAGVITGGPITAGIIYTDKIPQFEIFGDTIDYAKIISSRAPNNAILLARSTYELIYGSNSDIREYGIVDTPQLGKISSYIIQL